MSNTFFLIIVSIIMKYHNLVRLCLHFVFLIFSNLFTHLFFGYLTSKRTKKFLYGQYYISKIDLYIVTLGLTQFQSAYSSQWSLLLAGSVLSVLPLIIVYLFCQRYIIENSLSSGVKG